MHAHNAYPLPFVTILPIFLPISSRLQRPTEGAARYLWHASIRSVYIDERKWIYLSSTILTSANVFLDQKNFIHLYAELVIGSAIPLMNIETKPQYVKFRQLISRPQLTNIRVLSPRLAAATAQMRSAPSRMISYATWHPEQRLSDAIVSRLIFSKTLVRIRTPDRSIFFS